MTLYIGLLSGTSMDGIDAVLVSLSDNPQETQIIATHSTPIPATLKSETLTAEHFHSVCTLDVAWGHLFAESALSLLEVAGVPAAEVHAIGSHGQNLWHHPNGSHPFTLQIGDPNIIATKTRITTVADFRRADLALGGQGAPLVPRFHEWFFGTDKSRVIVNIGGIANITLLPYCNQPLLGFDTGPGNALMDAWIEKYLNLPFDRNGAFAASGQYSAEFLEHCLGDLYFRQPPPKSTGKEYFNADWVLQKWSTFRLNHKSVPPADIQATLLQLTSVSIARAITTYRQQGEVLVCGGGGHNSVLNHTLQTALGSDFTVATTDRYGLPIDWVEGVFFAWLAKMRLEKKALDYTAITGATRPAMLGGIYAGF